MSGFLLDRERALGFAREIALGRFPDAVCAWLAGSVAAGRATATSDLDVVVLLPGPPAPFRESRIATYGENRIPVELFVHTTASVRHYVAKDCARRQPTMARMVGDGIPLLAVPGDAAALVEECRADLRRGPDPLAQREVDAARYAVTDLLDDLRGAEDVAERAVVGATVWEASARLLLGADRAWQGTGKGLLRALQDWDAQVADPLGKSLTDGLAGVARDASELEGAVRAVLDHVGGPLFDGYRLGGET